MATTFNKYKIPLEVLKVLEPYWNKTGTNFKMVPMKNWLVKFECIQNPEFYFGIINFKEARSVKTYTVQYSPQSENSTSDKQININAKSLDAYFKLWTGLINAYDAIQSPEDVQIEYWQKEYFNKFQFVETERENEEPLPTEAILLLDSQLLFIEEGLKDEDLHTEQNKKEVQELLDYVVQLRGKLHQSTRKDALDGFCRAMAHINKLGVPFIKKIGMKVLENLAVKGALKLLGM